MEMIRALTPFFGEKRLDTLTIDTITAYQKLRSRKAGPCRLNKEIGCLAQIMKRAELWDKIAKHYKPLPLPKIGPGVAITKEEAQRLFEVGKKKKRWEMALWASILSANTAAGPGEISHLRLKDVDLEKRAIRVNDGVKNRYRVRTLELNQAAFEAVLHLVDRAQRLGANRPEHYLLPHRAASRGKYSRVTHDPTRPTGGWRTAWEEMRTAAGLPNLRQYDLRHTAITWMAAQPDTSIQTVAEIAGWSSPAMLKRYSHQSSSTRRAALEGLDSKESKIAQVNPNPPPALAIDHELKAALLTLIKSLVRDVTSATN